MNSPLEKLVGEVIKMPLGLKFALCVNTNIDLFQEKITGQRGTLPAQALGYVKFGKVIFRRPFEAEVCFPDVRIKATSIWRLKNHSKFCL